jgi:hypothetical protein
MGKDVYACQVCGFTMEQKCEEKHTQRRESAYERTRRAVYATGNKWAIENFHATHD